MNTLKDFLNNAKQKTTDFWGKLGRGLKTLIIGVAVVAIVLIVVVAVSAGSGSYVTLFSDMSQTEAAEVYARLQEDGVTAVVEGGTVKVPAENVEELRLQLTAEGFPQSGYNYGIYDSATGFGSTDADKQIREQFQIQENIMVTLREMDKVRDAKVLITMADDSNFVLSDAASSQATASVVLTLEGNQTLTQQEADLIRNLVSTSVPSLPVENITITDTSMNVYDSESSSGVVGGVGYNDQISLTNTVRNQLERQITSLFSPVFGAENLSASVAVTLNFDESVTNTVTLSPVTSVGEEENIGIITSMKQLEERVIGEQAEEGGEPGTDENGIAPTYPELDEAAGSSVYYQITNEINAEVNEINQTLKEAQGQIETLSCTLLINGTDELAGIEEQVAGQISTAIGVPVELVTVAVQEFNAIPSSEELDPSEATGFLGIPESAQSIVFIAAGVVLLLVLLIIFMMKGNKKKQKEMEEQHQAYIEEQERLREEEELARIEQEQRDALFAEPQNDTLAQLHDIINDNPGSIAQLLRNWLMDDYGRR